MEMKDRIETFHLRNPKWKSGRIKMKKVTIYEENKEKPYTVVDECNSFNMRGFKKLDEALEYLRSLLIEEDDY